MTGVRRPVRVLVVEDELLIRLLAVDIVEEAGFAVSVAIDADEAIDLLEARDDINILFTDIDMPGKMTGLALAGAVHDRWPPISIILTSGKTSPSPAEIPDGGVFVPKPYLPLAMVELLRQMAPAG